MVSTRRLTTANWLLRHCFTRLAADGILGVVSFADPVPRVVDGDLLFAGHAVTIYQAEGAILTGRSTRRYLTVLPDGTPLSDPSSHPLDTGAAI